jgi:hypothetical protein
MPTEMTVNLECAGTKGTVFASSDACHDATESRILSE